MESAESGSTGREKGSENTNSRNVAFVVSMDNNLINPTKPPPNRFKRYHKKEITSEALEVKQHEAECRRKENERQMIKRLIQKREECQKLNAHFEELLAQHAKFEGVEGTEDIPLMSKKELIEKFRTVKKGYSKMASCITNPNTS